MHRVNPQGLQRFDFTQGARGAQLDHVGGPNPRQHQQSRDERPQLAHDHNHHNRAQVLDLGHRIDMQRLVISDQLAALDPDGAEGGLAGQGLVMVVGTVWMGGQGRARPSEAELEAMCQVG